MSVSIYPVKNDPAARLLVLEGKAFNHPSEEYDFSDRSDATESGYFLVASALANQRVASVMATRSDIAEDYTGKGTWDAIIIRLKEAFLWETTLKDAIGGTVSERFAKSFQKQYFDQNRTTYQSPTAPQNAEDADVVRRVNKHIKEQMELAASTKDDLTARINNGYRASVFDTIKIDHGGISAKSHSNGILTLAFSGTCGGGCIDNSTLATESGAEAALRPVFPQFTQYVFTNG